MSGEMSEGMSGYRPGMAHGKSGHPRQLSSLDFELLFIGNYWCLLCYWLHCPRKMSFTRTIGPVQWIHDVSQIGFVAGFSCDAFYRAEDFNGLDISSCDLKSASYSGWILGEGVLENVGGVEAGGGGGGGGAGDDGYSDRSSVFSSTPPIKTSSVAQSPAWNHPEFLCHPDYPQKFLVSEWLERGPEDGRQTPIFEGQVCLVLSTSVCVCACVCLQLHKFLSTAQKLCGRPAHSPALNQVKVTRSSLICPFWCQVRVISIGLL